MIGIWGMGGIGKTTIAEAIFKQFFAEFEGYCFVNFTAEESKFGRVLFQQNLFSEILGDKNLNVGTRLLPRSIIDRLQRKKVFIVLDNVNVSEQLELLSLKFGPGSRIIVTSRGKQLLETVCVRVKHVRCEPYEIQGLNGDEALELFSLYAFGQKHPAKDFVELSKDVVGYVKGLPLALRVFGSSLCRKTLESWEGDVKKLKECSNREIDDVLKISFDGLEDRELKNIFLDIACFFKWEHKEFVESVLGSCYTSAVSGIGDLINRSVLTISCNEIIEMHDLLQQMAWNIIRQQSENPGEWSRLWTPEDIYPVLENETGTGSVQGMVLDLSKISGRVCVSPKAFARMYKLKFLKFYYSNRFYYFDHSKRETKLLLENGLVSFGGRLSYLCWDGYPSKSLPSNFCPKNLVELTMPNSHLEQLWDGVQNLSNLKRLDLKGSQHLIKIPDLSQAIKLEEMDLRDCEKLENFPSIVLLRSLKRLYLDNCSNIKKFPESSKNLEYLYMSGTAIEEVPSSIGHLVGLKELRLRCCEKLKNLPSSIRELKYLTYLDLNECSNVTKFPEIPDNLEILDLSGTLIKEVPSSIGHLVGLKRLLLGCCKKLKNLPSSIRELKNLKGLLLHNCSNVTKFPEIPENLEFLNLSGTSIEQVLPSIDCCSKLSYLYLDDCSKLCSMPRNSSTLKSCFQINVSGFFSKLEVIQPLLGTITDLDIHPSHKTAKIVSINIWRRLSHDCSLFAFTSLACMSSLTRLNLSRNNFETIPVCIKDLLLRELDISWCERLQSLPPLPPCLESLRADCCKSLEAVSSTFPIVPHVTQYFSFANCLKLDENCINHVKTPQIYQQKATADEDYYHQYAGASSFYFYFPGSDIPEWFGWKSKGSSVNIQLPPLLHGDNKFVGLALCTVFEFSGLELSGCGIDGLEVYCEYSFDTNNDTVSDHIGFYLIDPNCNDSDHVWLGNLVNKDHSWYGDISKHHPIEVSFKFYLRFRIQTDTDKDISDYCVVKECGVCLLYAQPSEESNSIMIQPGSSYDPNWPSLQCNNQDIAETVVEDEAEPSGNLSFDEEEEQNLRE